MVVIYIKVKHTIMEIDKIKRVILGCASEDEKEEVKSWTEGGEERSCFFKDAEVFYKGRRPGVREERKRPEKIWQRRQWSRKRRYRRDWRPWITAAACIAIAIVGIHWIQSERKPRERKTLPPVTALSSRIQLILPDGKTHEITTMATSAVKIPGFEVNEKVAVQRELEWEDAAIAEYMEVVVPKGGEYSLILADGTSVILNSETRLRFPSFFTGNERKIFLSGEAYFTVARDEDRPFYVEILGGKIRVLGTRFNVKARVGQNAYATLISGKVEILSGSDSVILSPGELCEIAADDQILTVREADIVSVLAWKNGEFVFKNASLEQVMNELARWYDVEIAYDSSEWQDIRLHVYMDRAKTLEEALEVISKMGNIMYEIEGRKITIKKR
ncbi:hypothetical protein IE90_07740 [Sanguibacteroides justesenii]|uniref:DUF4974 domain-containing protein n=2 Tax=Sanguibacteroides justesenii TaxID=1547597 RepID=A0A0C3NEA3_9PORP|nr:hypothetical protein BA92_09585 [Sanguibacteroides justesenii]KIO45302.1 hypothetical protein IE90_07740 [Sanguibacteroides justesenii]